MELTKVYARIMEFKSIIELQMGQSIANSGVDLNDSDKEKMLKHVSFAVDSGFNRMIDNLIKNEKDLVTKPKTTRKRKT